MRSKSVVLFHVPVAGVFTFVSVIIFVIMVLQMFKTEILSSWFQLWKRSMPLSVFKADVLQTGNAVPTNPVSTSTHQRLKKHGNITYNSNKAFIPATHDDLGQLRQTILRNPTPRISSPYPPPHLRPMDRTRITSAWSHLSELGSQAEIHVPNIVSRCLFRYNRSRGRSLSASGTNETSIPRDEEVAVGCSRWPFQSVWSNLTKSVFGF